MYSESRFENIFFQFLRIFNEKDLTFISLIIPLQRIKGFKDFKDLSF